MPVCALSSRKVVLLSPANRSNALASRKENERVPSRAAAAMSSRGTPARSKLSTQRALRTSPAENASPVPGFKIPSSTSRSTYAGSTPALRATSWRQATSTTPIVAGALVVLRAYHLDGSSLGQSERYPQHPQT